MKRFRDVTADKPVIMGRKTYESIGRPLPGRTNIIITRDTAFQAPGCVVVHSPEEALEKAGDVPEVMVIGGAQVYKDFLPMAHNIYLTIIDADIEGDIFFPEFDQSQWQETERQEFEADSENKYKYTFVTLQRK